MRRRRLVHGCSGLAGLTGLISAACLTLLLAGPGHAAAPAGPARSPAGPARPAATAGPGAVTARAAALNLEIHGGESPYGPLLDRVTLLCGPDSGSHPHPPEACAALGKVDGHIDRLRPQQVVCPQIFDPVTAVAIGHWNVRPVSFVHTYGNRCELERATGPVFTF